MTTDTEKLLDELKDTMTELEELMKDAAGSLSERAGAATESLRERLEQGTDKVRNLERELRRRLQSGAKAADHYVKDNPWRSVGIAAAVAFLLGALASHRD